MYFVAWSIIDDFENEDPFLQRQVLSMFPEMTEGMGTSTTFIDQMPRDKNQRALVVVWNASIPRAHYYREDSCIIILVENDEVLKM